MHHVYAKPLDELKQHLLGRDADGKPCRITASPNGGKRHTVAQDRRRAEKRKRKLRAKRRGHS